MTIKLVKRAPDDVELRLEGRMDSNSSAAAQRAFEQVCEQYKSVSLNFTKLDYISSAGLRVLLVVQKKVNAAGGRLTITGVSPSVQEVFEMTGFSGILQIV